eukprot:m.316986 g.316986  ORF g.316986 m.316986 type:complete len:361 (+) comp27553_c0_seq3:3959-5041(+)
MLKIMATSLTTHSAHLGTITATAGIAAVAFGAGVLSHGLLSSNLRAWIYTSPADPHNATHTDGATKVTRKSPQPSGAVGSGPRAGPVEDKSSTAAALLVVTPTDGAFDVKPGVVWEAAVSTASAAERAALKGHAPRQFRRRILCADALAVLEAAGDGGLGGHVITSLPCKDELSNLGLTYPQYREWFSNAARAVIRACPPDNFVIFYQSDEVCDAGQWHSKFAWIHEVSESMGCTLIWHKIVCILPPDITKNGRRPGYSHMVCVSRNLQSVDAVTLTDVLSTRGQMLWPKGMGKDACKLACRYIHKRMRRAHREDEASTTVIDPFCGRGTAIAVANQNSLHGYGIEQSRKRCNAAAKEAL